MSTDKPRFTKKQFAFISEYCESGENGTRAAEKAGYSSPAATACVLLKNPKIQEAIQRYRKGTQVLSSVDLNRTLEEIAKIAFGDLREIFDDQGRLLPPHRWSDRAAAAVSSFDVVTKQLGEGEVAYVAKIKGWDKIAALDKIMRHLGGYNDTLKISHDFSAMEEKLKQGRERVANLKVVGGTDT